jgi:hypothetical protein
MFTPDGRFAEGTYDELVELTKAFERLGRRISQELEQIMERLPRDENPPPAEIKEALDRAARDVFTGGRDVDPPRAASDS